MVAGLAFCVQQIQKGSFYGHITTRQVIEETRQEALRSGATCYAGKACSCGSKIRYTSTNACRDCNLKRLKEKRLAAMKYEGVPVLSAKQAAVARMDAESKGEKHYHGRPCYKCAGTLRHVSTSSCVACDIERKRK